MYTLLLHNSLNAGSVTAAYYTAVLIQTYSYCMLFHSAETVQVLSMLKLPFKTFSVGWNLTGPVGVLRGERSGNSKSGSVVTKQEATAGSAAK